MKMKMKMKTKMTKTKNNLKYNIKYKKSLNTKKRNKTNKLIKIVGAIY